MKFIKELLKCSRLDKKAAVALCDLSILLKLFPTSVSDCIDKHYHNDYVSDFSCLLLKVLTKLNDENLNSKKSPVRDAVDKLQSDFIHLIVHTYHSLVVDVDKINNRTNHPEKKQRSHLIDDCVGFIESVTLFLLVCFNEDCTVLTNVLCNHMFMFGGEGGRNGDHSLSPLGFKVLRILSTCYEVILPTFIWETIDKCDVVRMKRCMNTILRVTNALMLYQCVIWNQQSQSSFPNYMHTFNFINDLSIGNVGENSIGGCSWIDVILSAGNEPGSGSHLLKDLFAMCPSSIDRLLDMCTHHDPDMCMYFKNIIASGHGYVTRNHSQNPTSGIVKKDVVDATKTLGCGSKKDHCGVELDVSPLVSIFPEEPISFLRACLQAYQGDVEKTIDSILSGTIPHQAMIIKNCTSATVSAGKSKGRTINGGKLNKIPSGTWVAGPALERDATIEYAEMMENVTSRATKLSSASKLALALNRLQAGALKTPDSKSSSSGSKDAATYKSYLIQRSKYLEEQHRKDAYILSREIEADSDSESGFISGNVLHDAANSSSYVYDDEYDDQYDGAYILPPASSQHSTIHKASSSTAGSRSSDIVNSNLGSKSKKKDQAREGYLQEMEEMRRYNTLVREEEQEIEFWKNMENSNKMNGKLGGGRVASKTSTYNAVAHITDEEVNIATISELGDDDLKEDVTTPNEGKGDKNRAGGWKNCGGGRGGRGRNYDRHHQKDRASKKFIKGM